MLPRIVHVSAVGDFRVALQFRDGSAGVVDLRAEIVGQPGLFRQLSDPDYFAGVALDEEAGTIVWPNGVDLDPDVLYHLATGAALPAGDLAAS